MKKDSLIKELLDEGKSIGLIFIAITIILKIVFYKETIPNVLIRTLSIFWLFILPGYSVLLLWKDKLDLTSRIIMSLPISAVTIGIVGYYISLIGIHAKYHAILFPLVMIIAPITYLFLKQK